MLTGLELKIKRIVLGKQAREIAQVLGVSNAFVTYMETGKRNIPQDKYVKWVEYLEKG